LGNAFNALSQTFGFAGAGTDVEGQDDDNYVFHPSPPAAAADQLPAAQPSSSAGVPPPPPPPPVPHTVVLQPAGTNGKGSKITLKPLPQQQKAALAPPTAPASSPLIDISSLPPPPPKSTLSTISSTAKNSAAKNIAKNINFCDVISTEIDDMAANLMPTPFEGLDSESPDDFLCDVESFFRYRKLGDAEKIGAFALLLKGTAKYWLNSVQDNDKKSFSQLKEEFQQRFASNAATQFKDMAAVMKMQQMPHESVEQYINRGQKLAKRANAKDDQWLFALVNGFKEQIRANVIMKQASTLDKIRTEALLAEGAMPAEADQATNVLLQSIVSRLDKMDARGFQAETPNYQQPQPQFQTPQFQAQYKPQFQQPRQQNGSQNYAPKRTFTPFVQGQNFRRPQGFQGGRTQPQGQTGQAPQAWRGTTFYPQGSSSTTPAGKNTSTGELKACYRCGKTPEHPQGQACPAVGQTCAFCGKVGHFVRVCRAKAAQGPGQPPVVPPRRQ